jgi:hypothetical protein
MMRRYNFHNCVAIRIRTVLEPSRYRLGIKHQYQRGRGHTPLQVRVGGGLNSDDCITDMKLSNLYPSLNQIVFDDFQRLSAQHLYKYREYRTRLFTFLRTPGIDSTESIPNKPVASLCSHGASKTPALSSKCGSRALSPKSQ